MYDLEAASIVHATALETQKLKPLTTARYQRRDFGI